MTKNLLAFKTSNFLSPLVALSTMIISSTVTIYAAAAINDFETKADFSVVKWSSQPENGKLSLSKEFATSGNSSLLFQCPKWKEGTTQWPSFNVNVKAEEADWTSYDRLVIDIINPSNIPAASFELFVDDGNKERKSLHHQFVMGALQYHREVISLSGLPSAVDRTKISRLHFFTTRPENDLHLHLDNITLLKPGEALPPTPPAHFATQLAKLNQESRKASLQKLADIRKEIENDEIKEQINKTIAKMQSLYKRIYSSSSLSYVDFKKLDDEFQAYSLKSERFKSINRLMALPTNANLPTDGMLLGLATSTDKIPPREQAFPVYSTNKVNLSIARRGHESFQVLALPIKKDAHKVHLTVDSLKSSSGESLPNSSVECHVTGYVKTETRPPYNPTYTGWWADPILDFLGPIDIAEGDLQSFWVRITVPENQSPGLYEGKITVHAEGMPDRHIPLSIRVRKFILPKISPLPLAITFNPTYHSLPETHKTQMEWAKSDEYPQTLWKKHKTAWSDFLADYYINYDNLYRNGSPDWEILTRLRDQGRLRAFNLRVFDSLSKSPEELKKTIAAIRADYQKAKELNILDKAYIYGFDEVTDEKFQALEDSARLLKTEFPNVLTMTTAHDKSYGMDSIIRSIDAWCPLTPTYDLDKAITARAGGKQIWWYICCCPADSPHANIYVESPGIEARLLMGAMSAKYKVDGFLYYQISIWNSEKPITSGPFTDWNPRSWRTWNGDGSWTYVGPDGVPLSSIRLENFRDGLEDYAAYQLLRATLEAEKNNPKLAPALSEKWIKAAEQALIVPEDLVQDMLKYSRDIGQLRTWRERIDDLLDANYCEEIDPWQDTSLMRTSLTN